MLEDHAEEHGVVEREGKLQVPALVWTFVFGFAIGESRTLAGFDVATTVLPTRYSPPVASTTD